MKKMLINAANANEWRVALVENDSLYDLDIELPGQEQTTANIYQARVSRVEPSLGAAFIDYGAERHGFLSIKDTAPQYYPNGEKDSKLSIGEVLREGQQLIVQVEKEERGTKGAALTTYISLAGCYMVLMPNSPDAGGISRRIEGVERDELREVVEKLEIPKNMGVIIRTAGVGKSLTDLQWDLDSLLCIWDAIQQESRSSKRAPYLIHQESNVVIRAMRDHLRPDIENIIIDDAQAFSQLQKYLKEVRPNYADKVQLHQEKSSLFSHYKIESQTETVFQREVRLPSGGALVIDSTEALIAIDVNSSRATKGKDIEETALNTNLEAAEEIARQLRLRDLGGLITIDFIDMLSLNNKRAVEKCLREKLRHDRARIQTGNISRFGLLEMSRQRLRSALRDSRQIACPRCHGHGVVRSVAALVPSLLRLIEEEAAKDSTAQVIMQVPNEIATCLFNEKRQTITDIEKNYSIGILIIANPYLETPNYEIKAVTVHEYATQGSSMPSYELAKQPQVALEFSARTENQSSKPAVDLNLPTHAVPRSKQYLRQPGLLKRLFKTIFGEEEQQSKKGNKGGGKRSGQNSDGRRQRNNNGQQRRDTGNKGSTSRVGNRSGNNRGGNKGAANTGGNNRRRQSSATTRSSPSSRSHNGNRGRNSSRHSDAGGNNNQAKRANSRQQMDRQQAGRQQTCRQQTADGRETVDNRHENRSQNSKTRSTDSANKTQQTDNKRAAKAPVINQDVSQVADKVDKQQHQSTTQLPDLAVLPLDNQQSTPVPAKVEKKAHLPPPTVSSVLLEEDNVKLVQVETRNKDSK